MCRIFVIFSLLCVKLLMIRPEFATGDENSKKPQLIFANVMFRHGDRNIGGGYKNDPWAFPSFWPGGYGQLTNTGKQQQYELGKYFRRRYETLLAKESGKNINDIVYVQSTSYDRTLMSAAANLAGFFPADKDNWNSDLLWRPIPIHTMPNHQDHILSWSQPCPRYKLEYSKYKNVSDYQSLFKKYGPLNRYLEHHSGTRIRDFLDVWDLYGCLKLEQMRNFTLPEWTENVLVPGGDMEYITHRVLAHGSETPEMSRLKVGFFLREVLDRFKRKIESKLSPDRSIWMYSAHDSSIAILLNSLGLFEPHMPPFCATIFLELYKLNDQFYVQIFYKNSSADPLQMDIPSYGPMCPIDKFCDIYKSIIPTGTFEEECRLDFDIPADSFDFFENDLLLLGLMTGLCISILFGAVISRKFLRRSDITSSKVSGNSFYHTHDNNRV